MIDLEIIVPTLNREEELLRMQKTAECGGYPYRWTISREDQPRPLPTITNELIARTTGDVIIIGADDIEFQPNSLKELVELYKGSLDLVVGFYPITGPFTPNLTEFGYMAIGREFIRRFPDGVVSCPFYHHFYADTELGLFAKHVGKYVFGEHVKIIHRHPMFPEKYRPVDQTHRDSRIKFKEDLALFNLRQSKGLLWGKDWNRE